MPYVEPPVTGPPGGYSQNATENFVAEAVLGPNEA